MLVMDFVVGDVSVRNDGWTAAIPNYLEFLVSYTNGTPGVAVANL